MAYNHETFMQNIGQLLAGEPREAELGQAAFELVHEIVGNLNFIGGVLDLAAGAVVVLARTAEAREERESADLNNYIREQIREGVEKELAKPRGRSYIGKQSDDAHSNKGTNENAGSDVQSS